ncbi:hypothetical protein GC194_13760 [bacterium]|nr:hypothetical protein [bacterium]
MKKFYNLLFLLLSVAVATAQSPSAINYQAVLRNSQGEIIKNQSVSIRLSVLKGSATGAAVYTETHSTSTNEYGMVNLQLGNGSTSGNFKSIDWGSNAYYLKVELDETGGTSFKNLGTSQLVAVPYAMYANKAGSVANGDKDSTNELQTISRKGRTLSLSGNNSKVDLRKNGDNDSLNEIQSLSLSGNLLSLSKNGGSITLPSGGGSSYWTKSGDSIYYAKYARVGTTIPGFGARLAIGATSSATNAWGIYSLAKNGSASNYGLNAEVASNSTTSENNASVRGYANTENGNATTFRGLLDGKNGGFGTIINTNTNAFNVSYYARSFSGTSSSNTSVQYGADLTAIGQGTGNHYGIRGTAAGYGTSTGENIGGVFRAFGRKKVWGIGTFGLTYSTNNFNVGTYAASLGSGTRDSVNYGLVASASNADTNYAAYLLGNVSYTGTLTGPSDARFKSDVNSMQNLGALDKIMMLRPVTYNYKTEEYNFMNLPAGSQFGFIAQELHQVFPELVTTQMAPVFKHNLKNPMDINSGSGLISGSHFRYQGVNYIGLIPVLTQAMQEQQQTIQKQTDEVQELKNEMEALKKQNEELKALLQKLIDQQN